MNIPYKHQEIYDIVYSASGPIYLSDLADQLGYGNPHAVAKRVSAAYWWFEKNEQYDVCEAIAHTFVDRNGNYPWA